MRSLSPNTVSMRRRYLSCATLLALSTLLAACRGDGPTQPALDEAPVTISASLAGTGLQALSILVSGPAIATPIVVNLSVPAGAATATTTVNVTVGAQRTFVARGFDANGEVTHEGMATATVRPSGNPPVAIRMYHKTGDVPITIGVGTYGIAITPSPLGPMVPLTSQTLSALVTDADGGAVPGATVTWGSLNPVVASVSPGGVVTAHMSGTTTLFATYQGTAASVDLTVLSGTGFRAISSGLASTCALDQDGAAWCWGYNVHGQLGDGTSQRQLVPVAVSGGMRFTSIATGYAHACGVSLAGEGWCWGLNNFGQLGTGQTSMPLRTPQRITGGQSWSMLAPGTAATCGIATDGAMWCWGLGTPGTIGLAGAGQSATAATPGLVNIGGPWSSLAIAPTVGCGIAANGQAVCSGGSMQGHVTTANAQGVSWRSLDMYDSRLETIDRTTGGFSHTYSTPFACGVTTSQSVSCWGHSLFGELGGGVGATETTTPAPVAGAQGYDAVTVGGNFACGLRGGQALCWGRNDHGQLGDGSLQHRFVPTPVLGGHNFTRISAGFAHACGLRADGAAYCWGLNLNGEVGDGTTSERTAPARVLFIPNP